MFYKTPIILAVAATVLFASNAYAGDKSTKMEATKITKTSNKTETLSAAAVTATSEDRTEVLGAQTTNATGLIAVQDENGRTFYNRVVPQSDLLTFDYDVDVIDTVSFEHDGRSYTNKVVKD